MFAETFTFGVSRTTSPETNTATDPTATNELVRCASPCSSTVTFPSSGFSVTDLSVIFANSRLRQDAQICYDSCETYAATDDDAGWQLDPLPTSESTCDAAVTCSMPPRPSRTSSPSRRTYRQAQTRQLCSRAHHKEISDLVSRMVECEEQCSIVPADAHLHDETTEDEGYDSSDDVALDSRDGGMVVLSTLRTLTYRRSFDTKSSACVNKAVRFRKGNKHRRLRSSESDSSSASL